MVLIFGLGVNEYAYVEIVRNKAMGYNAANFYGGGQK